MLRFLLSLPIFSFRQTEARFFSPKPDPLSQPEKNPKLRILFPLLFNTYILDKMKHFIRTLIMLVPCNSVQAMTFVKEFIDLKAQPVYIEMNIPLLQIRRKGLPYPDTGMCSLNGMPGMNA